MTLGTSALRTLARVLTLTLFSAALPAATAAESFLDNQDIFGLWVDHGASEKRKVAVLIEDCNGQVCGRIVWMKKAQTSDGQPKRDAKNTDAALRERPLCGLQVLDGFRHVKENVWNSGQIYNPDDGQIYRSSIGLMEDGSLEIRAYIGIPLFGKTLQWVRPQEDLPRCNEPPEYQPRLLATDAGASVHR